MITIRLLRTASFGLLAVVTLVLAVATVSIHLGASESLYTSWPLVTLWALIAVSSFALIALSRLYRRPAAFGIHLSLLAILAGACVTHFFAASATVHLRVGGAPASEQGVRLERFDIATYPATDTPRDFACTLATLSGQRAEASINRPASLRGWSFVITSYDADRQGVTLTASRDPWGVGLSYAGYILLAASLIAYFFSRRSAWRQALRQLAVMLPLAAATSANAGVTSDFARDFGGVMVNYNGRICPMTTLAKDFTTTLTGGAASCCGADIDEVLAGFLFDFSEWRRRPAIRVKSPELKAILQIRGRYASYDDFFNAVCSQRLNLEGDPAVRQKFASEIDRFATINMLVSGELLRIFPIQTSGGEIAWLSPISPIPADIESDQWLFIRKYLGLLNEQVQRGDRGEQARLLGALHKYQANILGSAMPSASLIRLERRYDRLSSLRWPPIAVGAVGAMLFIFSVFSTNDCRWLWQAARLFAAAAATLLAAMIAMRWRVSGHLPLSNGYESMQFLALTLLLLALVGAQRRLVLAMGILAAGLALGVAAMCGSGSSISGLMPVLDSPLLSVHVMLVMTAYALLLLMALTGVAGLFGSRAQAPRRAALINVMLYPALALLAMGIFVGAVWANQSWGRYWGWDPKEVWALITLLTYSFAAHPRLLPLFRKPRALMWFAILAFSTVIITYFGVNFILGGLHSYA